MRSTLVGLPFGEVRTVHVLLDLIAACDRLAVLVSDDVSYRVDYLSRLGLLREEDEMMDKLYALFGLSVRYLADTYGVETCARVYLDVRGGTSFEEAFMNQ
jgi:hypothetical protein